MLTKDIKFTLNDVFIAPSVTSTISSRGECDPHYQSGELPLFTAPMSSIVDEFNYALFETNGIKSILPRNIDIDIRLTHTLNYFSAFSLNEFEEYFIEKFWYLKVVKYVLIDVANGHMIKLHNLIKKAKEIHGNNIIIMAGNIANPETYLVLSEAGADYVRLGIGTGSVCITSSNSSVHYPIGSLIKEVHTISLSLNKPAKIIADGGMKNYSDIIKALALGADYVMCGGIFVKMLESASATIDESQKIWNQYDDYTVDVFNMGKKFTKNYYGMSTKKAQRKLGNGKLKTSEGIEKVVPVEYTMGGWVDNFKSYLTSAMSYSSAKKLDEFIGEANVIMVTNSSTNAINP